MRYAIDDIAKIIQAADGHWKKAIVEHILIDSRKIVFPASSLFFALTGPRRNGHLFIEEAYQAGVRNFVVSTQMPDSFCSDANFLKVPDVLKALQAVACAHRKKFQLPVIGITGSNGKTIVKEWLYQLLHNDFSIVRSPRSYNSQIGVPLSVSLINEADNLGIFEAGISKAGEMGSLEQMIAPTIGVFTGLGEAHSEGFLHAKEKLQEKFLLFSHVDTLVYASDAIGETSEFPDPSLSGEHSTIINWSRKSAATVRIKSEKIIDNNCIVAGL
ncbi:MAG: hypothetical protein RLZZ28_555, partial [Bacteroidota bacterium]